MYLSVCNSPLNRSPTKQLYSFPKSKRFMQRSLTSCDQFYERPNTASTRKAGIGYGKRIEFAFNQKNPAPNIYEILTSIEVDKKKRKGWIFGVGREDMATSGILSHIKRQAKIGPGQYSSQSSLSKISYTMRPKTGIIDKQKINIPGPGSYQAYNTITDKGKLFVSKYHSSGATTINPPTSERFESPQKFIVPGPGTYKDKMALNKEGRYQISKFKSSKVRSFPHEARKSYETPTAYVPGPGSYKLPSDFGYIDLKSKSKKKLEIKS